MHTAIVGINWGDEGKGRMVDLLSADCDIVCRYQGGNNAGHTVVNSKGKFILNLLPSGVLRGSVMNVMGPGMVIDLEHLCGELRHLAQKGVHLHTEQLMISDKAFICLPWHKRQDILEEERLGDKQYGSTRRGIAPAYGDKYMKKGLRMGDLLTPATLAEKVEALALWKNITFGGYGTSADAAETLAWLERFGGPLLQYIGGTTEYLASAHKSGKQITFEAQLGALRDIDYGIYPYTTSSQTLAAYAPIGAGLPGAKIDRVIGVMKAYSSCVGEGPFAAEFFGEQAEMLRKSGAEYGAATGRPRRVGGFDAVASRYGVQVQGADALALTKLDVLAYMEKIPVCTAYEIDGLRTNTFPGGDTLLRAKPVYEYLEGFGEDISGCRSAQALTAAALRYIEYIENAVGCPVTYVSVGPERDAYFVR